MKPLGPKTIKNGVYFPRVKYAYWRAAEPLPVRAPWLAHELREACEWANAATTRPRGIFDFKGRRIHVTGDDIEETLKEYT